MKSIIALVSTMFICTLLSAQIITNNVRQRIDPIISAVKITDSEKIALIKIIEVFQSDMKVAFKQPDAAEKKETINKVSNTYNAALKKILGKERYDICKLAEKEVKTSLAQAPVKKEVTIPAGVLGRLEPIVAAVSVTDTEKIEIATAIATFQKQTSIARSANDKHKAIQVNKEYQSDLNRILGQERYYTLKKAEKETRKTSK